MSVDEAELGKFIETAKQSGTVSTDELRRAFPIDTMGGEDIAAIVLRLEEAGVSVEIDPSLFSPKHGLSPNPLGTARTQPPPATISTGVDSRVSPAPEGSISGDSVSKEASSSQYSSTGPSVGSSGGKRVVFLLMLLVVIAFLAIWGLSKT